MAKSIPCPIPDSIDLHPLTSPSGPSTTPHLLIYFITGNPGIIGYYTEFLQTLREHLHTTHRGQDRHVHIYGASLSGFELHTPPPYRPLDLGGQIDSVATRIGLKAREIQDSIASADGKGNSGPLRVVLVGHSVGAYIALEVIAKQQRRERERVGVDPPDHWKYVGGICLFPTVVEIANSQQGRTLRGLLSIPFLPTIAQTLSHLITYIPPRGWLDWAAAFTPGSLCKDATEALFRSKNGIHQLIYLASDEMRTIRADIWPSTLWGIADPHAPALPSIPKLFFYWGHEDYWVDNGVRDALIARRGRLSASVKVVGDGDAGNDVDDDDDDDGRPEMLVSPHRDISHCFSLERLHMDLVARQVAAWVVKIQRRPVEKA